jgi:NAD(P)H-hydrate repair Nnr-like enzyme with NAD(P)H-hydrate dehydratase domain
MSYIKQTAGQAYYQNLLFNKPENKALAGKILIIGGNLHGINAPSLAYSLSITAGAGETKVILPQVTKKLLGPNVPVGIEFSKNTPSGSFSKEALSDLLSYTNWADINLLAGDFSKSSETAILIEDLLQKSPNSFVLAGDSVDFFAKTANIILSRPNTTIVADFGQLQQLLANSSYPEPLKFSMPNNILSQYFSKLASQYPASIVTVKDNNIYILSQGQLAITTSTTNYTNWQLNLAVLCSVWQMQNPSQIFKALTTATALL